MGLSDFITLNPIKLKLLVMEHRSLVWRIHSVGVHFFHTQKAHCLQHLQQQQKQQIHVTKLQWLLQQFPKRWWAFWNVQIVLCSALINSWISPIFTLAIFKSSTDDKTFVKVFCKGISCNCFLSAWVKQQSVSTEAVGNTSLVNYYVPEWIKHTRYYVQNILCIVGVNTIFHAFVKLTDISLFHTTQ